MTKPAPETIRRFFQAMQAGAASAEDMMALFTEDAVYTEPFSGSPMTHRGKAQIRRAMEAGWAHPLPDMTITIDRVEVTPGSVTAEWTCRSPALPGGQGSGTNVFRLEGDRIASLETILRFEG